MRAKLTSRQESLVAKLVDRMENLETNEKRQVFLEWCEGLCQANAEGRKILFRAIKTMLGGEV